MKKFRIGIVGAGVIARNIHLPILKNMTNVEIAWITDAKEQTTRSISQAFRVPFVSFPPSPAELPECEVALLAIPVGFRRTYYEAFANRGIAVFAEKPFSVSLDEHKRILGLFPPHRIACGYMRRNYAANLLLRRIVAEKWFGRLQRIRIAEGYRGAGTMTNISHYDDLKAAGGGILISLGCHDVDLAFYITGTRNFRVSGKLLEMDEKIDRKVEASIKLFNNSSYEDESCDFDLCVSWLDSQENSIQLHFPEVIVSASIMPDSPVLIQPKMSNRGSDQELISKVGAKTTYQAFFLEWNLFLRGLEEEKPSVMAASTALPTSALIDALYKGGNEE